MAVKEGRKFKQCCEPDLGGNYLALIYDKDGWSAFYAQTGHGSGVFRNVQLENDGRRRWMEKFLMTLSINLLFKQALLKQNTTPCLAAAMASS